MVSRRSSKQASQQFVGMILESEEEVENEYLLAVDFTSSACESVYRAILQINPFKHCWVSDLVCCESKSFCSRTPNANSCTESYLRSSFDEFIYCLLQLYRTLNTFLAFFTAMNRQEWIGWKREEEKRSLLLLSRSNLCWLEDGYL